jgi:hypothetical protein
MLYSIINCNPEKFSSDSDKILSLGNLLRSHAARNNIVIAEKNSLFYVAKSNDYSVPERCAAQEILDSLNELGQLKDKFELYCEVDFSTDVSKVEVRQGKNVICVGYSNFIDFSGPPYFVAENIDDFRFYEKIADYYIVRSVGLGLSLRTKFSPVLGAGSHCKSEFDRHSKESKFVLCIVDNDKKHPSGAEGETAKGFKSYERRCDNNKMVKVLDVHEVECLVPMGILHGVVVEQIKDKVDTIDEIKKYVYKNPDFQVHFDYKNGYSLRDFIEMDSKYGNFWLDIINVSPKFQSMPCVEAKKCNGCDSCPKVDGISQSIIPKVNSALEIDGVRKIKLDAHLVDFWRQIGVLMLSWGCALKSKSARVT